MSLCKSVQEQLDKMFVPNKPYTSMFVEDIISAPATKFEVVETPLPKHAPDERMTFNEWLAQKEFKKQVFVTYHRTPIK